MDDLEYPVEEAQQDHHVENELLEKVAQLEHQELVMQIKNNNLLAELQDLDEREDSVRAE